MKFDCGPTWVDRHIAKHRYLSKWHLIFAFRPRRVDDGSCVWLEYVWRKGTYECDYGGCSWRWEYKEKLP